MSATPRPWRFWWFGESAEDATDGVYIEDADEQPIGQTRAHKLEGVVASFDKDTAALIVRAVNAHDTLVGALRDVLGLAAGLDEDDPWFGQQRGASEILARARATLDSLKPEKGEG